MLKRALCFLLLWPFCGFAKTVIPFWHAFAGGLGKTLVNVCEDFNHSQPDYEIKPIYKGSYQDVLTSFVSAFKAGKQPPLVHVYEVGSALLLNPPGVVKPVEDLFAGSNRLKENIFPSIYSYYSDNNGRLMALPFNSSAPVLFYNKTLLDKLNKTPPKTWEEVYQLSKYLRDNKVSQCGLTTTYPSWIHIESFLTWHDLPLVVSKTMAQTVQLNYSHLPLINHLKLLKKMQDEGLFHYGGREGDALALFTSGFCPLLTESSGAYNGLHHVVPFELGVSALPYQEGAHSKDAKTVIGGAAIWVSSGFDNNTYRGVKAFMSYLLTPSVQSNWQIKTGYMPISSKARALSIKHAPVNVIKGSMIAISQTIHDKKHQGVKDNAIGFYALIRLFNDQQIESILSGMQTVEAALAESEQYANTMQRRFRANVTS